MYHCGDHYQELQASPVDLPSLFGTVTLIHSTCADTTLCGLYQKDTHGEYGSDSEQDLHTVSMSLPIE